MLIFTKDLKEILVYWTHKIVYALYSYNWLTFRKLIQMLEKCHGRFFCSIYFSFFSAYTHKHSNVQTDQKIFISSYHCLAPFFSTLTLCFQISSCVTTLALISSGCFLPPAATCSLAACSARCLCPAGTQLW